MTLFYTDTLFYRHTHTQIDKYTDGLRTNTYIQNHIFEAVSLTAVSFTCWETQDVPQDPSIVYSSSPTLPFHLFPLLIKL